MCIAMLAITTARMCRQSAADSVPVPVYDHVRAALHKHDYLRFVAARDVGLGCVELLQRKHSIHSSRAEAQTYANSLLAHHGR